MSVYLNILAKPTQNGYDERATGWSLFVAPTQWRLRSLMRWALLWWTVRVSQHHEGSVNA